MRLEEYAAHDALALAELVREAQVTPAELAHLAVRGADRTEPRLGAIAGLYDDAVESAEAAEPGPFHGVPVLLKDLFHGDAGRPTEAGSRLAEGWVAQVQSELVRRVRACGMVPVGRATTWPAARAADRAPRWARGSCRSRPARTAAARSGSRHPPAEWWA